MRKNSGSKEHLIKLLERYSIPWQEWGKGFAQTLDHLLGEIEKGETVLTEDPPGKLVRRVSILYIDIFYLNSSGKRLKLIEEKQVFKDGRERRRELEGSIAEKLQNGEKADESTARRAIQEELGIESPVHLSYLGKETVAEDSPSYPGLLMEAVNYHFEADLDHSQFRPEGYIEFQEEKDIYFIWGKEG